MSTTTITAQVDNWEIDFGKEGVPAEEVVKFLQEHME